MKIQCDVCEKEKASVFCAADEAALCEECDQRVHHANKLASKHHRFSLLHPSFKEAPLCDICQERKALLFCKEDRAILCRECDIPIHKANEQTQNHNRFLLTGVELSASLTQNNNPNSSSLSSTSYNPSSKNKRSALLSSSNYDHHMFSQCNNTNYNTGTSVPATMTVTTTTTTMSSYKQNNEDEASNNSTIDTFPECLTETLPGWRLEDLLGYSTSHDHYF